MKFTQFKLSTLAPLGTALGVALLFSGCQQDPTPVGQIFSATKATPHVAIPNFALDIPSVMEFTPGQYSEFPVHASVPSGKTPVVEFEGLPKGAVYAADRNVIGWTPTVDQADLTNAAKTYAIKATVTDPQDSVSSVQREAVLLVRTVLHPLAVNFTGASTYIYEGASQGLDVRVVDQDFPQGPFNVSLTNDANDPSIDKMFQLSSDSSDPTHYTVTFKPGYGVVKKAYNRQIKVNVTVARPQGGNTTVSNSWQVYDQRIAPTFNAPSKVTGFDSVSFTLTGFDPNFEVNPSVAFRETPEFGKTSVKSTPDTVGNLPASQAVVSWTDLPPSVMNTTQTLKLKVCVLDSNYYYMANCTNLDVSVTLKSTPHLSPVIGRKSWDNGVMKYVLNGKSIQVPVSVTDAEDSSQNVTVTIEPSSVADEVSWNNGTLDFHPVRAGVTNFQLVATSAYGVVRSEAFSAEALPASWAKNLVLAEDRHAAETQGLLKSSSGADAIDPTMQGLGARELAMRRTLIIGTDVMQDDTAIAAVETASTQVKNVILSTPLLSKLNGPLWSEIQDDGVVPVGRFLTLSGHPSLANTHVVVGSRSGLDAPHKAVTLLQTLTSESASPMVLSSPSSPTCSILLSLQNNAVAGDTYPVAMKCPRNNGGVLILIGFEWPDLNFDSSDSNLSTKWFSELGAK